MDRLKAFHAEYGDVIVKPLDGMGGTGIFRLQPGEPNRNAILETLTHDGRRSIMAQRYIPEISQGDKRILLIGGEAVPYCLARIPLAGETRGNLAAGGRGVAQPLSDRDREIARAIAPALAPRGLLLVGLDVIGDYITEINVTSPTCFVEIAEQTGFDVAGMFVSALERAVARPEGDRAVIGLVLVAHHPVAAALAEGARHVLGEIAAFSTCDILADEDPKAAVRRVRAEIARADCGSGVLVLTDMKGATPSNIACQACAESREAGAACELVAGLSMPMLLRALTNRNRTLNDVRDCALVGGVQGVVRVD